MSVMEYSRYLDVVERFFNRAGISLKKRGKDYPESSTSPEFVILDDSRKAYYLTVIAMPPEKPEMSESARKALIDYAEDNSINSEVFLVAISLAKDLYNSRYHSIDLKITEGFQKKLSLVVPDNITKSLESLLKEYKADFQTVPLQGVFKIYFFSIDAYSKLEDVYKVLVADEEVEESKKGFLKTDITRDLKEIALDEEDDEDLDIIAPSKATEISAQADFEEREDDFDTRKAATEIEAESSLAEKQKFADKTDKPQSDILEKITPVKTDSAIEKIVTEKEQAVRPIQVVIEDKLTSQAKATTTEIARETVRETVRETQLVRETQPLQESFSGLLSKGAPMFAEKENPQKLIKTANVDISSKSSSFKTASFVFRHIWSFIAYCPSYIFSCLVRGKLPDFITYWVGGISVLLGIYFFPLYYSMKPFAGFVVNELYGTSATLSEMLLLMQTSGMSEQMSSWVDVLFGASFILCSANITMLQFLNSVFYLHIFLALGYFVAMAPPFRDFGKRIIAFFVTAYLFYAPLALFAAFGSTRTALYSMSMSLSAESGFTLMGNLAGIIAMFALVPVAAGGIALKACRSKQDIL